MIFLRGFMLATALFALSIESAAAQGMQRRPVTAQERQAAREALDGFTAPTLTLFRGEEEFRRYVVAAREAERTRFDYDYSHDAAASDPQFANAQQADAQPPVPSEAAEPLCPPDWPGCVEEELPRFIIVTGTAVAPARNPSITNNQTRGIEEGDIVKQIDHYLLVLQDGRIFVIDTRAEGGRDLALVDRADAYRDPQSDIWYDEMLVFGDRVLVTGYAYGEGATELVVFRLSETGRLSREGVFRLTSNDYYSAGNYATRLVGGNLVIYSPLAIREIDEDFQWPVARRWLPQDDARARIFRTRRNQYRRITRDSLYSGGRLLMNAAAIYRPVRRIDDPVIHSLSICPLASSDAGGDLDCRTTSFVGSRRPEWYLTEEAVYLWTDSDNYSFGRRCGRVAEPFVAENSGSALVYRVPVSGELPGVVGAYGTPPDQFAMQTDARNLYALVRLVEPGCGQDSDQPTQLAYASLPLAEFGPTLTEAPASAFTSLPGTATYSVASRFTERYLVYGGLSGFRRYPNLAEWDDDDYYRRYALRQLRPQPAYVVPIERPEAVRRITIGHTVIRAERVADDILLTGYRDGRGLSLTLIGLDGRPRVASTALLSGRYESEGRSHAFNSLIDADGSGLMGLPTVHQASDSDRYSWRSTASDLSFLALDTDRRLTPIGELERRFDYVDEEYNEATNQEGDGVPGYECEVSCIDWYGNSRPIFTDGRIFGLSGAELIEGRVEGGRIEEVQRLNIALSQLPDR